MTLTITIDLDNAAFDRNKLAEVRRILKEAQLSQGRLTPGYLAKLRDVTGNTVGKWEVGE